MNTNATIKGGYCMNYIIGQALGIVATVCTIILPFFKKKWQILALNIAVNLLVAMNYVLIGQIGSAAVLCLVAVVQSIVSMIHSVKGTQVSAGETILFAVLYVGCGLTGIITAPGFVWAVNYENLLELLPIVGALMLMISVFAPDEQTTRKYLLVNGIIWTLYALAVGSTTFLTNLVAAISTASALYKYRKKA